MRASFFLSSILSRNSKAQTEGIVAMAIVRERDVKRFSPLPIEVLVKACPLRIKTVYAIQAIEQDSKSSFFNRVVPGAVQVSGTFFGKTAIPVFGDTIDEIRSSLEGYGLKKDSIPSSCGGSWDYQTYFLQNDLTQTIDIEQSTTTTTTSHSDNTDVSEKESAASLLQLSGFGTGTVPPSINEALEKEALLQVEDALGVIPEPDKVEYMEAKAINPAIVELESNPALFLRVENYNPWAAARRLVAYWKERKATFGDGAFEPLTFDSLSADAKELIDARFFEILPNDSEGRPVVCANSGRQQGRGTKIMSNQDRLKAIFYMARVVAENPQAQQDSVVSVHTMFGSEKKEDSLLKAIYLFGHIFPVRWTNAHFVCLKPEGDANSKHFFSAIFNIVTEFAAQINGPKLWIHVADSNADMLTRLETYGFQKDALPDSIGGSLDDQHFQTGWNERRTVECQIVSQLQTNKNRRERSIERVDEQVTKRARKDAAPSNTVLYEYDDSDVLVENPSIRQQGLLEMEAAINLLPDKEKSVLLEARREIPDIVEHETPCIRFLRVERYNAWAAAKRMALYWKERKNVFGERAFLPLNQTGEGALSREDVAFLNSGFFALLGVDDQGRSVICHDSSRRTKHCREPRLRLLFYFWTMLSENEVSQVKGYQTIVVMGEPTLDSTVSAAERLVAEAMPTRVDTVHVCNVPSISRKKPFMDTMVSHLFQLIGNLKKRSHVHVADSKEELAKRLLSYDIPIEIIPKCLGGKWGYEEFSKWQEARLRYEWDLPSSKDNEHPNIPEYHAKSQSDMSENEKTERKRRMNVLHSRRRRERVRVEMEVYAEQVAEIQDENAKLRKKNTWLEDLLYSAKREVAKVEGEEQNKARREIQEHGSNARPSQLSDAAGSGNNAVQLLLNSAHANDQRINFDRFIASPSHFSFEAATGMAEPSSFSLSLENRQTLANTLALQHAHQQRLSALAQHVSLGQPHLTYEAHRRLSTTNPANHVQEHDDQQRGFLTNLINGGWFRPQGGPPPPS
jgi:hypothetical protein